MVDGSEEGDKSPSRNGEEDMSDEEHAPIENDDDIIELGENEQIEDEEEVVEDMAERTLAGHEGSVFCVAISKDEKLLLTGGEDDTAIIWDVSSDETTSLKITHKDSVTHVGFAPNDKYYFSSDIAGYIQVFETASRKKIWDFEVGDVLWVMWHPVVPILMAGAVDGGVWMWKVPSFETKTIQLSSSPAVDAAFLSTNRHLAVGYQDGWVKVIDLKSGEATVVIEVKAEITNIAVSPDDKLILAGTPEATVCLIAAGTGKVIARLMDRPSMPTPATAATADQEIPVPTESVEDITFHPSRSLVAVSLVSDRVCVWDTARTSLRGTLVHPDGVVKSRWAGDSDRHLVTACLDGVVRVWDVDQATVIVEVTGHTSQILDMAISENIVATADDSGLVKLFRIS